jgi:hypothetical protein
MKRLWVVGLTIFLGCVFGYFYSQRVNAAAAGEFDNFTSWPPSAAVLQKQMAEAPKTGQTSREDQNRKQLIGKLLTSRFRGHDPKIAVRIKFEHDKAHNKDYIKLMCPARMEPWNMDWLAVRTWQEVKDNLGASYDLDVYITYIGLNQIKVAELRSAPGQPDKVEIRYRLPSDVQRALNGEVAADGDMPPETR